MDQLLRHSTGRMRTEPESLRLTVRRILEKVWPQQRVGKLEHLPAKSENEGIYEEIDGLGPKDEGQRGLRLRAMSLPLCVGQARWLIFE